MPRRGRPLDDGGSTSRARCASSLQSPHSSDVPRPPGVGPAARGHLDRVPDRSAKQFARGRRNVSGRHRDRASADSLAGGAGWVRCGGREARSPREAPRRPSPRCLAARARAMPDAWENGVGETPPGRACTGRTRTTPSPGRSVSLVSGLRGGDPGAQPRISDGSGRAGTATLDRPPAAGPARSWRS